MPLNTIAGQTLNNGQITQPKPIVDNFQTFMQQNKSVQQDKDNALANLYTMSEGVKKNREKQQQQMLKTQSDIEKQNSQAKIDEQKNVQQTAWEAKTQEAQKKVKEAEGTVSFPNSHSDEIIRASFSPEKLKETQDKLSKAKDDALKNYNNVLRRDQKVVTNDDGSPYLKDVEKGMGTFGKFDQQVLNEAGLSDEEIYSKYLKQSLLDAGFDEETATAMIEKSTGKNTYKGGFALQDDGALYSNNPFNSGKLQMQREAEVASDEEKRQQAIDMLNSLSFNELAGDKYNTSYDNLAGLSGLESYGVQNAENPFTGISTSGSNQLDALNRLYARNLAPTNVVNSKQLDTQAKEYASGQQGYSEAIKNIQNRYNTANTDLKNTLTNLQQTGIKNIKERQLYEDDVAYQKRLIDEQTREKEFANTGLAELYDKFKAKRKEATDLAQLRKQNDVVKQTKKGTGKIVQKKNIFGF